MSNKIEIQIHIADENRFCKTDDLELLITDYKNVMETTALEMHESMTKNVVNNASRAMDSGKESYLISKFAVEMGMYPFNAIFDIVTHKEVRNGIPYIGIDLNGGTIFVTEDTLIAWR